MKPQGLHYVDKGFPVDQVDPVRLRLCSAASLADLEAEYAFYTPAAVYAHVPLGGQDPWGDFLREHGRDVRPVSLFCEQPLFAGLDVGPDLSWNYVLWGLPREHWAAYKSWAGTLAFYDPGRQTLTRVRTQELLVVDPFVLGRSAVLPDPLPRVAVTAFVLESDRGCWYFVPGAPAAPDPCAGLPAPPRLVYSRQAYADTRAFRDALVGESPDPYRAVDRVTVARPDTQEPR